MKTFPLLLLMAAIVSCVQQESRKINYSNLDHIDSISEISREIFFIPLETNECCKIRDIKQIRRIHSDILILSDNDIYHFDHAGSFKKRLFFNQGTIECFTFNPTTDEILLLNTLGELFSYAFENESVIIKHIKQSDHLSNRLIKIEYYNHHYWAIAENLSTNQIYTKYLFKLDKEFQILEKKLLINLDLGYDYLDRNLSNDISVINEKIYAYTPSCFKETLVRDTLSFISNNQFYQNPEQTYAMPFRLNSRYLIAYYQSNVDEPQNYIYCFDKKKNKPYGINGLNDDLCNTGLIQNFYALSIHSKNYCFYKTSSEVGHLFPERTNSENPVLFFVEFNV